MLYSFADRWWRPETCDMRVISLLQMHSGRATCIESGPFYYSRQLTCEPKGRLLVYGDEAGLVLAFRFPSQSGAPVASNCGSGNELIERNSCLSNRSQPSCILGYNEPPRIFEHDNTSPTLVIHAEAWVGHRVPVTNYCCTVHHSLRGAYFIHVLLVYLWNAESGENRYQEGSGQILRRALDASIGSANAVGLSIVANACRPESECSPARVFPRSVVSKYKLAPPRSSGFRRQRARVSVKNLPGH